MPRIGRLHIPGGTYHLLGRGLERRNIFDDDSDKQEFLTRLGTNLVDSEFQCLAWAIMSNHYHLLIRVGSAPLAKLMSPLLSGFAGNYNRRHHRSGYVFQNRYTSILCDTESYLLKLIRYIHLNPLRAGMLHTLAELDRYPWTGHAGIMGNHQQNWQLFDEVLGHFGTRPGAARRGYRKFLASDLDESERTNLSGGGLIRSYGSWETIQQLRKEHRHCIGDERILGDSKFVERVLAQDQLKIQSKSVYARKGWDLDVLIKQVCLHCEVDESNLVSKARANQLSRAKSLICYLGARELGIKRREIADRLQISQSAASYWIKEGKLYCRSEKLDLNSLED
jgi:putative transposase